jgi:HAD superfamily hydrolase (TIGR01549 family)
MWVDALAAASNLQFGVVFDFDGTLVDSYTFRSLVHFQVSKILVGYEKEQGLDADIEVMASILYDIEKEMTTKMAYDREAWFSEAVKRDSKQTLKVPKNVLVEAVRSYWNSIIKLSFPYPGAVDALVSLKKKSARLGLVSDTDGLEGMKRRRLKLSGIENFFGATVISGEDTKEVKPDKAPFIRVCKLLGVSPEYCVYIGDNPNVDVSGAKQVGMKTILINNPNTDFETTKTGADYILKRENFSQLEPLIYRLLKKTDTSL